MGFFRGVYAVLKGIENGLDEFGKIPQELKVDYLNQKYQKILGPQTFVIPKCADHPELTVELQVRVNEEYAKIGWFIKFVKDNTPDSDPTEDYYYKLCDSHLNDYLDEKIEEFIETLKNQQ
jgi:hypothetical protein